MTISQIKRVFKAPNQSFFLFGPRGTGKSTLLQKRYPNALVIDLLLSDVRRRFISTPEHLLDVVRAQPNGQVIVIDEIQKVPELLSLVHVLIEEKKGWQFILTGSSARKLKKQGVDLLGGRAIKKILHPFMASELETNFKLEDALINGLLPLCFKMEKPQAILSTYIDLYLDEEVKAEGIIRNIEPFTRFLEVMSFSHGSVLNISNIARECAVKRTTIQNWVTVLEDLLISYQIPVFTKRAKRTISAHPKFFFFDAGVYRSIRPRSILDSVSEIDGAALEGLVAQHLRAWIDYTEEPHKLYFWRTKSGLEVDFILYGPLGFWAIEVKSSTVIHPNDLRPLEHFLQDYPEAKAIFLYRGKEKLLKKNILCLPCEEFLLHLQPDHLLPL